MTGIIDAGSVLTLSEVIYSITYVVETAGMEESRLKPADLKLVHTTKSQLFWMDRWTRILAFGKSNLYYCVC